MPYWKTSWQGMIEPCPTLVVMKTKYEIIKNIHSKANESGKADVLKSISSLFESWNIRLRTDDGELYQVNISNPEQNIIVVGLRYLKKDGSFTEDIFEFSSLSPNEVSNHYKGRYERQRTEYKDTHKQQNISESSFTSQNSCGYIVGKKLN
ncbi:MAG: hypothetical protein K8R79_07140 [Calditrichales bacterium]|nr:hypothetical protein [Calditrichales bacterium]